MCGSDIQTPYGLIEVNDEDLSDNVFSQGAQPSKVDLCPSNLKNEGIKVFNKGDEGVTIQEDHLWISDSRSQEGSSQVQAASSSISRSQQTS